MAGTGMIAGKRLWLGVVALLFAAVSLNAGAGTVIAQTMTTQEAADDGLPPETVEADISAHSIDVKTDFAGVRVIVFGAVANSRQKAAEDGLYDIAIVLEGPREVIKVRRKSRVAGIWINTDAKVFENIPNYYSVLSTRPLDEIASDETLKELRIGFEHLELEPREKLTGAELDAYRKAIIRIKRKDGLFRHKDVGVAFTSRSLFRATFDLPANVAIGPFVARIHLFRDGRHLASHMTSLDLKRAGVERLIHAFAFDYPFLYGVAAVIIAVLAGLAATAIFKRR